jgi:hypothetical protein
MGSREDPRFDDDDSTNQGESGEGSDQAPFPKEDGSASSSDQWDYEHSYGKPEEDDYEDSNSYAYEDDMMPQRHYPKMKRRSQTHRAKRHWINRASKFDACDKPDEYDMLPESDYWESNTYQRHPKSMRRRQPRCSKRQWVHESNPKI